MKHALWTLTLAAPLLATVAHSQPFAVPPDDSEPFAARPDDAPTRADAPVIVDDPALPGTHSVARVHVGPAVQFDDEAARAGLGGMVDFGRRGAGLRFTGLWAGTSDGGSVAQYTAELWIDFASDSRLHPIVSAGAGLARLDGVEATADGPQRVGIGIVRAGLEYQLPVRGAEARAGLSAFAALPAVGAENVTAWGGALASVGVGF